MIFRYLYISTSWPQIAGWNEERWVPLRTNDLYDFKWVETLVGVRCVFRKLEEEKEKTRTVRKYYREHMVCLECDSPEGVALDGAEGRDSYD